MTKVDLGSSQEKTRSRLENNLLLAKFIARKLGLQQVPEIKQFSDVSEGFGEDGRSFMYYRLVSKKGNTVPEGKLRQYDDNITRYFQKLKRNREEKISFKYYQHLALLYSEIYLDNYFQNPIKFLNELNQWVEQEKSDNYFSKRPDLQKIAYWMATGSGKTLIMHANYWQFLAYNKGPNQISYDNIILITTGDDMSQQHLAELKASGIPATLFQNGNSGYFEADKNTVKVISIHKLKMPEDKKGDGVSIDISTLGTKNIVFVDEGHKGQKGQEKRDDMKWKSIRERLAKDGFTFEYSATFGQVIETQEALEEYSKAILFDYSYKYFYSDGYGKDFRILNMGKKEFNDKQTKNLLLANAMAFYEQLSRYQQLGLSLKEYNIEKPLWIFVGSKVQSEASDVLTVVRFLNWLLNQNKAEVIVLIQNILNGQSGIIADSKDVFAPRYPERNFTYFRENKTSAQDIYSGILKSVFYCVPEASEHKLYLIDLKEAEGEIALKTGASEKSFGIINVGDKAGFLKLFDQDPDIKVQKAALSKSLFEDINKPDSTINMLIGSKKFVEGWNSWRVSTMSLLYIGKGAGPQIIQLFGRGVRLKGKTLGLKRSQFVPPPHPPHIEILETLQIFGVQANYMENFKEIIDKEEILNCETTIPVKKIEPFPHELQTIVLKDDWTFQHELLKLELTTNPKDPTYELDVKLDLIPRAIVIDSRGDQTLTATAQTPQIFRKEIFDILDWDDIYHRILEYKNEHKLFNIAITKETLKQFIYNQKYTLLCDPELINPKDFQALENSTNVVVLILQKYLNLHYSKKRNAAEKGHVQLKAIDPQSIVDSYTIKLCEEDQILIDKIKELVDSEKIYALSDKPMPISDLKLSSTEQPISFQNAPFKAHLYQPLLVKQDNQKVETIPTGLNQGEKEFVADLKRYVESRSINSRIYLLRNPPKGGVGFYESHSFYPDFILWVITGEKQAIVFIDPKGLVHMAIDDPKLNLHRFLKEELQKELGNPNVKLDAFVISVTDFSDFNRNQKQQLSLTQLEQDNHVLFPDVIIQDKSCIERMFDIINA